MKWVFIFLLPIFIFSCNANSSSDEAKNESSPDNHKSKDTSVAVSNDGDNNLSGCYWKVLQRDTFVLHLAASGNDLSGKLTFNNFEKDKSSGIVRGKIEGDILKLWYSFQSEGMQSLMEVYFKKQGDHLIRGLGPVTVKGDSAYFSSDRDVDYNSDQTFTRVDCATLPSKYR